MNKKIELLFKEAVEARKNSYSPYSNFKVGAVLLLKNGEFIKGANIENASYGLSNCAERSALFQAYSLGYNKNDIDCMAIVASSKRPVSPCGACRQVMSELLNPNTLVYLFNVEGEYEEYTVEKLLPYSFFAGDLDV